jgi:hypothetical protein
MTKDKLKLLFDLARELWAEQNRKNDSAEPLDFCWARNKATGEVLIFSEFAKCSRKLEKVIEKHYGPTFEKR